ncbi:hypothetical protein EYF80_013619 [Liparis tanakae]|uniref:Uncharacterized protein n=1 Tax=Liparis tanakae TaxID=230148 RepID=A0A4Z2IDK6_9TELE|nr:hypothetical protein EYF80_013619 [Liparis tanakae]
MEGAVNVSFPVFVLSPGKPFISPEGSTRRRGGEARGQQLALGELMQCGLAFSKAGQCRIASLRKEMHHKEREDRGGGEGQRSTMEPAETKAESFASGRVLLKDP